MVVVRCAEMAGGILTVPEVPERGLCRGDVCAVCTGLRPRVQDVSDGIVLTARVCGDDRGVERIIAID